MAIVDGSPTSTNNILNSKRVRLEYLDGVRGLAALYVVLCHTQALATTNHQTSRTLPGISERFLAYTHWLTFGHVAVAIFIVLSGFCLMLPVVNAKDRSLPGGLIGFIKRRARRILPPYYAALLLSIGLIFISQHQHFIKHSGHIGRDFSPPDLISHFLLIQDLFQSYRGAIDAPLWTVAYEWKIYFVFALLLLPIWRQFGTIAAVASGFIFSFVPPLFLRANSNFHWSDSWYIALFSLGMASAIATVGHYNRTGFEKMRPFLNGALAFLFMVFVLSCILPGNMQSYSDICLGIFVALLLYMCAQKDGQSAVVRFLVKVLESKPAMFLGAFSYSIYLIHFNVIQSMTEIIRHFHFRFPVQIALIVFLGLPICLLIAYVFHVLFERPFMPGRPRTERRAEIAAIVSPAP